MFMTNSIQPVHRCTGRPFTAQMCYLEVEKNIDESGYFSDSELENKIGENWTRGRGGYGAVAVYANGVRLYACYIFSKRSYVNKDDCMRCGGQSYHFDINEYKAAFNQVVD